MNFNLAPYLHTLNTLNNQASKPAQSNSKPTQVNMLLKQLDTKLKAKLHLKSGDETKSSTSLGSIDLDGLKQLIESTVKDVSGHSAGLNKELLRAVDALNANVKQIKKAELYKEREEEHREEIEAVFVNPISEKDVKNIKGNLTIGASEGDNVKSKLAKLKSLNKG
jgi:predicted signal transduction protein with EAL and GGDEF domain